jgi:hypothetical protein
MRCFLFFSSIYAPTPQGVPKNNNLPYSLLIYHRQKKKFETQMIKQQLEASANSFNASMTAMVQVLLQHPSLLIS